MSSKILKAIFEDLVKKIRKNLDSFKNLTFLDIIISKTAVKTCNLCLNIHKNTQDLKIVIEIIQVNNKITDKIVKDFIKIKKTSSYYETYQVIREKIKFSLKNNFDAKMLADAVEKIKK